MKPAAASDRTVTTADNFGDGAQAFHNELLQFEDDCAALAKLAVTADGELNAAAIADNQTRFADLMKREVKLRQAATTQRDDLKRPFWDECQRLDADLRNTLARLLDSLKAPKSKFDAWAIAENAKREAAAKAAREEAEAAQRRAEEITAKAEAADPFAAFDAAENAPAAQAEANIAAFNAAAIPERTRIATSAGNSVSVRTSNEIVVEDHTLAFPAVANNKGVCEAIEKAIRAYHKSSGTVPPGCKLIPKTVVR